MLKLLNPGLFTKMPIKLVLSLLAITVCLFSFGLYQSLIASPVDYQQGEMVRVMYVHVPAAWMSLGIYIFIAICSFCNLVWKTRMSYILAIAAAPIGTCFALITLVTGSLWGKPIWGTWWVWDARLTSMLVLFLLYLSYMAVASSGNSISRAERPASVVALIGLVNIPIVKFSVDIWYSLHQPASILRSGGPSIHNSMLIPLLIMFVSFIFYFIVILILRTTVVINKVKSATT